MQRWLSAALAALLIPAGSASAMPVMLVATPEGMRPIAIYEGGKFFAPSADRSHQDLLGKDLLGRSRDLTLYFNGEALNRFRLDSFAPTPARCSGSGLWPGSPEKKLARPMLAFTPDFPGPRRYVGSLPATSFASVAQQMSRKVYQSKRLSAAVLSKVKIRKTEAFTLMNGMRTFVAVESDVFSPARSCPDYSLLLILEQIGRRWQTQLQHFRHNTKDCANYRLVGTFGTGNSIDQLAIQGSSPDARWYDLYQAQPFGGLKQVFHGGGHSCLR